MRSLKLQPLTNANILRSLGFLTLLVIGFSCGKDQNKPEIGYQLSANELIYYPEKHLSFTFEIIPKDTNEAYTLKWFNPDSLEGAGPNTILFSSDIMLDFELAYDENNSKRFNYQIDFDTIDSLKYDYRNHYHGKFVCEVTATNNGSTETYQDTLTVVKHSEFPKVNILTRHDILHQYEGNQMIYLNSNGFNNSPNGAFFGYHSGVSFRNDSIIYSTYGPLGNYYALIYKGVRLNEQH